MGANEIAQRNVETCRLARRAIHVAGALGSVFPGLSLSRVVHLWLLSLPRGLTYNPDCDSRGFLGWRTRQQVLMEMRLACVTQRVN